MKRGLLYGIGAYLLWGLLPVYWKWLHAISPTEIVSHRIVWSLVFTAGLLAYGKDWKWLKPAITNRKTLLTFLLAAGLLGLNWLVYVWGVNNGPIVETSLGYCINPLISVLLGVLFLREKMRNGQWLAMGIAAMGVLYLTISYGAPPWISLVLAFSFGFYGLLVKTAALNSVQGLTLETAFLSLPALAILMVLEFQGTGAFGHANALTTVLLILTGVATALPLIFFATAAREIPLSMVGILQYIAPTLQFSLGVMVYGEPFDQQRAIGFGIIWTALAIYSIEGIISKRRTAVQVPN